MNITIEQIDNLRGRANVSYSEAKEALEVNNGNMIDAIIYLESQDNEVYDRSKKEETRNETRNETRDENTHRARERKNKQQSTGDDILIGIKKIIRTLNETRVILYNNDRTILDISMTITLLLAMCAFPLTVTVIIVAILTGNKIKVKRKGHFSKNVNDIFNNNSNKSEDE